MPKARGRTVSWRCWTSRSPIWPRCPRTQSRSKTFVPGGMSGLRLDGLLEHRIGVANLRLGRRLLVEGGRVLTFAHLLRDRLEREKALDRAGPIDHDPGLDVR